MDLYLKGKRALVTGASRGIGRAVAVRLAEEGCDLILAARDEGALTTLAERLSAAHEIDVEVVAGDLTDPVSLDAVALAADTADILVNNAGATPRGTIEERSDEDFRAGWELKLMGYVNMTRELYTSMRARGGGVIINIIGVGGVGPSPAFVVGGMANAALINLTLALGGEGPANGVRVVGINPGKTATDRFVTLMRDKANRQFGDPDRWPELTSDLPFGRPARPEEVADLAAFLASDRASYISGEVINIDGGFTAKGGRA